MVVVLQDPPETALQISSKSEVLPLISFTGCGGVTSILISFDDTCVESPALLVAFTVT